MSRSRRRRRAATDVLHRSERSAELGVTSAYEVISEADLAFSPNEVSTEKVAVFQVSIEFSSWLVHSVRTLNNLISLGSDGGD